jgi:predicted phosphodiesterase
MRVAALYDIHGNLDALDAVLAEVRDVRADLIVVGGDIYPGPLTSEVLARLQDCHIPTRFILGNGDRAVLDQREGRLSDAMPEHVRAIIAWLAARLEDAERRALASWPGTLRLDLPGLGRLLFVHATPWSDTVIFTRATPLPRLRRLFHDVDADIVICGHTHMQFDRELDDLRIVNAGSVGMAFGEPGACWLLLEPGGVTLRRTSYDLAAAAARIRSAPYPDAEDFASRFVLDPPSEESMLELYAKFDAEPEVGGR